MLIVLVLIAALLGLISAALIVGLLAVYSLRREAIRLRRALTPLATANAAMNQIALLLENISKELKSSAGQLNASLVAAITDLIGNTKKIAVFSVGQEKISVALVESVTKLEESVDRFTSNAFGTGGRAAPGTGFADLARQNTIDRLKTAGYTDQEAQEMARHSMAMEAPE